MKDKMKKLIILTGEDTTLLNKVVSQIKAQDTLKQKNIVPLLTNNSSVCAENVMYVPDRDIIKKVMSGEIISALDINNSNNVYCLSSAHILPDSYNILILSPNYILQFLEQEPADLDISIIYIKSNYSMMIQDYFSSYTDNYSLVLDKLCTITDLIKEFENFRRIIYTAAVESKLYKRVVFDLFHQAYDVPTLVTDVLLTFD
jgi:hypothetical protein